MEKENLDNVTLCNHPLIQVLVTDIRNEATNSIKFRRIIKELSRHVVYEALRDVEIVELDVKTPIALAKGADFKNKFILAPILRAGLSMIDGAIDTLPFAEIRHIGLYRNEETLQPVEYYVKLPNQLPEETEVIIMDPMLATGGSAISAIDVFLKRGIKAEKIKFLCLISSSYGIKTLNKTHPEVKIYTASIDKELNEKGYIVPGLGDAGDRCFGT